VRYRLTDYSKVIFYEFVTKIKEYLHRTMGLLITGFVNVRLKTSGENSIDK
jgi:hypothetical protein